MDDSVKNQLILAGIDVDSALKRFMDNEKLLQKTLHLFLQDTNFVSLLEFLDKKDSEQAYRAAHTIKGLCGNLSMNELFSIIGEISSALQNNDLNKAQELLPLFAAKRLLVVEAIQKWT